MSQRETTLLDQSLQSERVPLQQIPIIDFGPFLGGDLEARTEVAREIGSGRRLGAGFYHISNAIIYDLNPGSNSLLLALSF